MSRKLVIPGTVVSLDERERVLKNHIIEIEDGAIVSIKKFSSKEAERFDGEIIYAEHLTVIPGFVQTHIHLCQSLFRGLADDLQLLDWLQLRIFPYENAHNKKSLRASVRLGINELLRGGTTAILDLGTLRHQEVIFEELISSGIRAIAGKCMMDENELFPAFKSTTADEILYTRELAETFHNSEGGRIKYGFAPRFALSSSAELMRTAKEMMGDFNGSLFHTHSSENKKECEEIQKKFNLDNVEYFESLDLLGEQTVLAHSIHLNEKEIGYLKKSGARVSHCPSSNLKLGSGIANIPGYLKEGISISLGADGAPCNNNLSAFTEMRLASLIQKPIHGPTAMDAKTVLRLATIEGAKALHLDKEIGSIETGKKADLVFLNLDTPYHSISDLNDNVYSNIVYSASAADVTHVMVNGEWKVRDGRSLIYDDRELIETGRSELKKLLEKI